MIQANLATFPPRAGILMQTVQTILPQVDRLCICLNGYDRVPAHLGDDARIQTMIPDRDLKDAGKFAFAAGADDMVFTIDDDILYPPDYVARTIAAFDRLDPSDNVLGYQGNAWVFKDRKQKYGWRNFLFHKPARNVIKVDILGTGTACQLGRNLPSLDQVISAAGFIDLRHSRLHVQQGRSQWILPREKDEIASNMRAELWKSSLFACVHRTRDPQMVEEHLALMQERSAHSGLRLEQVLKRRAKAAAGG
ncbi:hypothetical protein FNJ84_04100 [Paracoccus sp. M683]|uniref:hypothetical protein n=1 Tax=Paracoccus sp. M683 TaxID=2594268 RepID=UPI001191C498|nr:hypothetical protein [Paracoccus sp. M683]TRW98744.1 hypothetical protein FNJ84_04100 [Paracoccus sp. M683]